MKTFFFLTAGALNQRLKKNSCCDLNWITCSKRRATLNKTILFNSWCFESSAGGQLSSPQLGAHAATDRGRHRVCGTEKDQGDKLRAVLVL